MTRQKEQITSVDAANPAFPVIFGPILQPAAPKTCRQGNSRANTGTADAPDGNADAFLRANPDALLEGLLAATRAAFEGSVPD